MQIKKEQKSKKDNKQISKKDSKILPQPLRYSHQKKTCNSNSWQRCDKSGTASGNVNQCCHYVKHYGVSSKN